MGFRFGMPPAIPFSEFAGLYVADGSTPQTTNIAPTKLTAWTSATQSKGDLVASPTDDNITIVNAGTYMGMAQFSFSGTISESFEMHLRINGIEQPEGCHRKLGTGGDVGSASFIILPAIRAVGDIVTVYVESALNNRQITIVDAQFVLYRID